MTEQDRLVTEIRQLTNSVLALAGEPSDFWGTISVSVQGGNPHTVRFEHTIKPGVDAGERGRV